MKRFITVRGLLHYSLAALLVATLLGGASCGRMIARMYGVKKPHAETDASVLQYVKDNHIDYDYVVRPANDTALLAMMRGMKMGYNGILICDSAGNELGHTNDSTCHLRLRSQITELIKKEDYPAGVNKNFTKYLQPLQCLSCAAPAAYARLPKRRYVVYFSVAKFIPIKKKLSDVDFIDELKADGLRQRVTVVIVCTDVHQDK